MAQPLVITQLADGQYQVTARLGGAEEATVGPLASQEQADLVCDLLTIKAALEDEEPLAALQLRSQAGPPTNVISPQAAELVGSTKWAGLVAELQACAEELQHEDWQDEAALGNGCTAQLLLLLQPAAASVKGGIQEASPLHHAAEGGHIAIMRAILSAMPGAVHLKSHTNCSPLLYAASTAQPAAVRLLLELAPAAAVHASSSTGALPLHMAATADQLGADDAAVEETVWLLLAAAPDSAMAVDFQGETALYWGTAARCQAAVRLLLAAAPAAATVANDSGCLPVHMAAAEGTAAMLQLLLDAAPASITAPASGLEGQQPIHRAASRGNTAAVETLLAARPDLVSEGQLNWPRHLCWRPAPYAGTCFPDFVATRLPLSNVLWVLLPRPCPGLGRVLPTALEHGIGQAQQLVRHLPAADMERLRLAALCLARAQRRTRVHLPPTVTGLILSLFDA
ncbi:hypothetical protein COHA_000299 [Chlorella ohadii]|uniref:Uncharacterized protein n=1 Tax=Chlorella ohadii TaxID=2649997 RepID=A0AAD5H6K0_9CHLO|nr:hypothetical protein COHA_000299 [Chlorella ohadii]